MRKLVLKMSLSLDGFVAGPNGEVDWLFPSLDAGASAWLLDTLWMPDVHLMGGATYRAMATHWPHSREPFAAPMNEIPKFVFSSTVRDADWGDTHVINGDLHAEIARLKQLPGRDMLAHGGARFARSLIGLDHVDEFRLLVHPVVLGRGLRLFDDRRALTLMASRPFASGAMAQIYQPATRQRIG